MLNGLNAAMLNACKILKVNDFSALADKCETVLHNVKELEKTVQVLNDKLAVGEIKELLDKCEKVNGVRVIANYMANSNGDILRKIGDQIKSIPEPVVAVLFGRASETKGVVYCACSKEAIALGAHAGNILRKVSALTGGKGGGKPDSAMGGVGDIYKIDEALAKANEIVGEFVNQ